LKDLFTFAFLRLRFDRRIAKADALRTERIRFAEGLFASERRDRRLFRDVAGRNVRIFKFTVFSIDMDNLYYARDGFVHCFTLATSAPTVKRKRSNLIGYYAPVAAYR
jgi:hypothetical protein